MQNAWFWGQVVICLIIGTYLKCSAEERCERKHVTVTEMKDIVIGRCFDFQTTIQPGHFCTIGLKNCSELWEKFSAAFIDKPQCNVTAEMYTDFIDAANYPITGKQLFYSGLYGFAQRFSVRGARYITLEDTLIGYLIDGIRFCGGSAGENAYDQCEEYNQATCPNTASGRFWEAASTNFAKIAVGHVYTLLTTVKDPIVRNHSYFNTYEVTNLQRSMVTQLTVILINDSPLSKRDPCNKDESLKALRTRLEAKNIAFECKENPKDLVYLYCMENEDTALCQSVNMNHVSTSSTLTGNFVYLYIFVTVRILKSLL